ncbi:MAG: formate/nitrite transporter family protein [Synergistaceae bacterium]|nr:formate/nitrite transporter family protein [Synergistaceae bacterium]
MFAIFEEEFLAIAAAARKKADFLSDNPAGYFISSMLAGIYVGFGALVLLTIGGLMDGAGGAKLLMGGSFSLALSLVIFAGAELFTGSNFIMASGLFERTVSAGGLFRVWLACYIGNWAGSILLAALYWGSGISSDAIVNFIAVTSAAKMNIPPLQLFIRGILCNLMVCLGVWCCYRCKSEGSKLIMIFWCIYAFATIGFEHSVANMTILTAGMLLPHGETVSAGGYFYNILVVTAGNIAGGVLLVAAPYFVVAGGRRRAAGKISQE